jgi:hypothetical protein
MLKSFYTLNATAATIAATIAHTKTQVQRQLHYACSIVQAKLLIIGRDMPKCLVDQMTAESRLLLCASLTQLLDHATARCRAIIAQVQCASPCVITVRTQVQGGVCVLLYIKLSCSSSVRIDSAMTVSAVLASSQYAAW